MGQSGMKWKSRGYFVEVVMQPSLPTSAWGAAGRAASPPNPLPGMAQAPSLHRLGSDCILLLMSFLPSQRVGREGSSLFLSACQS